MATNDAQNAFPGYIGLKDLTTVQMLAHKRVVTENLRTIQKRDWALNRAFYNGQQWSFWNPKMQRVEDVPLESGPKWKVRLQDNKIKPGLANWVAMMTKTRPVINAEPDSSSDTDVKSAQMGESLYEYEWDRAKLNSILAGALFEAGLSGGYIKCTWDPLAAQPITFMQAPDGTPITDEELAGVFEDQLTQQLSQDPRVQQSGQDPAELATQLMKKVVYLGDIRYDVMSAENVLLDPSANTFAEANWVICTHPMDPDEVQARFGVKVHPDVMRTPTDLQPMMQVVQDRKEPYTLTNVYVMYIRPCPALQKGRYVAWVEGADMQILDDMPWPYPHRKLPLIKLPGMYRPNSPYDDPIVNDARALQKAYNKSLSDVLMYQNITIHPQMLAPVGSLRQKITTEPGAVWEYNPVMNQVPQWRPTPALPSYVFENMQVYKTALDTLFMRVPTTRDTLPARTDTGTVLEGMAEAISDQMSTMMTELEDSLAELGHMIAAYAQEYYIEPRLLKIRGAGGSVQVKKFMNADIAGGFTFRPRYGTGLPLTRAGKQAAIIDLVEAQVLTPQQALKQLDLGNLKGIEAQMAADEDQAFREHDKLLRGQPINMAAMQQAQQQIEQMVQTAEAGQPVVDPTTGEPIDPQQLPQQIQQMMQTAMNAPTDYEDWSAHLDTHGTFMKSQEWETYPPDVQARFLDHFNQTFQRVIDVRKAQMTYDPALKPKVSIQMKGAPSPQVVGEILREAGVDVSDQDVAAPPLDTWVTDDLTKPDVQQSGDTQMDPLSQQMDQLTMQAQSTQMLSQAASQSTKAAAEQDQSAQSAQMDQAQKAQQMRHAEELHQQKLAHGQESHQNAQANAKTAADAKASEAKKKKPASGGK